MATGGGSSDPTASAERRAAAARARSAHETSSADQHEALAKGAATEVGRDVHLRMAAVHRSTAACHTAAARLHEDYAIRLAGWAGATNTPRPLFMTGVAAACGTRSAALTLVGATFDQLSLAASDEPSRAAQELEFLLGEGPARDATSQARAVTAVGSALTDRWPGYGPAVTELGIDEVTAVPLSMSGTCVGALTIFDPAPRLAGSDTFAEVADVLTRTMILNPEGDPELYGGTDLRAMVHQAAGMVSVQLDCPVADALELIKARAFTEGTSAHAVAERILRGELRLG
ncbi:ANTAR domain-containing protein [Streptomyces sp. NPDC001401]|uniref:ANTAR domain-containing protein n=1 Tax=Streptomyces sp. NPDC001401 TaxID=3364570 RepID=UPI00369A35B9